MHIKFHLQNPPCLIFAKYFSCDTSSRQNQHTPIIIPFAKLRTCYFGQFFYNKNEAGYIATTQRHLSVIFRPPPSPSLSLQLGGWAGSALPSRPRRSRRSTRSWSLASPSATTPTGLSCCVFMFPCFCINQQQHYRGNQLCVKN